MKLDLHQREQPEPISRHRRNGVAFRLAGDLPRGLRQGLEMRRLGWFADGVEPFFSVGLAYDHSTIGPAGSTYKTSGIGLEVEVAKVVAFRLGHYEDKTGDIDGSTDGWGVALPLGRIAGVRYERARIPQAEGLRDVERKAFSAFVDPVELWSALRSRR